MMVLAVSYLEFHTVEAQLEIAMVWHVQDAAAFVVVRLAYIDAELVLEIELPGLIDIWYTYRDKITPKANLKELSKSRVWPVIV